MNSISEIKAAYNAGAVRSRAAAIHVARLFPCLRGRYPENYDCDAWTPQELADASRKMSTGEAECAKFVLMVYNYSPMTNPKSQRASGWKCGLFNIAEANSHWDKAAKAVLIDWINNPLYL